MAMHHRGYIPSAFPTHRELLHLTGGKEEVGVAEEERESSDMDGEEGGGVPVEDPDSRIKRQHVSGHAAKIVTSLHVKVPHQHPLQVFIFSLTLAHILTKSNAHLSLSHSTLCLLVNLFYLFLFNKREYYTIFHCWPFSDCFFKESETKESETKHLSTRRVDSTLNSARVTE